MDSYARQRLMNTYYADVFLSAFLFDEKHIYHILITDDCIWD